MSPRPHRLPLAALAFLALLPLVPAHARLEIGCRAQTPIFLLYEPVTLVIELANQTSRDLTIGGENASAYLTFDLRFRQQARVGRYPDSPEFPPIFLPARSVIRTNLNLLTYYDMRRPGAYTARAIIHWDDQAYASPNTYIDIMRGAELLAISSEYEGDGSLRTYTLETIHRDRQELAFLRIEDETHCYGVIPLGRIIKLYKPKLMSDAHGNIHVLIHAGPANFARFIVRGDGVILDRQSYASEDGPMDMIRQPDGQIRTPTGYDDF